MSKEICDLNYAVNTLIDRVKALEEAASAVGGRVPILIDRVDRLELAARAPPPPAAGYWQPPPPASAWPAHPAALNQPRSVHYAQPTYTPVQSYYGR